MIIQTTGHTKDYPYDFPIAFDTNNVLYLHGYNAKGSRTLVHLKHNRHNSDGSESVIHLFVNMSFKDIVEKMQ